MSNEVQDTLQLTPPAQVSQDVAKSITFFVPGVPIAKGSKRAFTLPNSRRVVMTETNASTQKPWMSSVGYTCQEEMKKAGFTLLGKGVPVLLALEFRMPRPQTHYYQGQRRHGELRDDAPRWCPVTPDKDKLARCIYDALKGVAYYDDAQVVTGGNDKVYPPVHAPSPGVLITLMEAK